MPNSSESGAKMQEHGSADVALNEKYEFSLIGNKTLMFKTAVFPVLAIGVAP